jgi:hypothetical protein
MSGKKPTIRGPNGRFVSVENGMMSPRPLTSPVVVTPSYQQAVKSRQATAPAPATQQEAKCVKRTKSQSNVKSAPKSTSTRTSTTSSPIAHLSFLMK